ncbi:MAG: amino acid-binding protein [Thermodesulfobacteriota bacterium]|nr:amino acid-binding protein [Thermodesulfobacteriota bacterium]
MGIKQISVKTENISGKLSYLSDVLGQQGVNIRAISVGEDTSHISLIHMIVDEPDRAMNIFKAKEIDFDVSDVLAVEMPDHPGGMNAVLRPLRDGGINVISMYPYIGRASRPIVILKVDDLIKAVDVLKRNWVRIWDESLYRL